MSVQEFTCGFCWAKVEAETIEAAYRKHSPVCPAERRKHFCPDCGRPEGAVHWRGCKRWPRPRWLAYWIAGHDTSFQTDQDTARGWRLALGLLGWLNGR